MASGSLGLDVYKRQAVGRLSEGLLDVAVAGEVELGVVDGSVVQMCIRDSFHTGTGRA